MINADNLNPRQKIYLTALLWLIALSLVVIFIVRPLIAQIKNDGLELTVKKQDLEAFYTDWQILEKAQKDYQSMQNEINGLPAILPADDALKFIVLIEKISQATNNQQTVTVEPKNEKNKKPEEQVVNFQIGLRGEFPDLLKFLVYLENAPYYNRILTLDARRLSAKENENAAGALNTILSVAAYQ